MLIELTTSELENLGATIASLQVQINCFEILEAEDKRLLYYLKEKLALAKMMQIMTIALMLALSIEPTNNQETN